MTHNAAYVLKPNKHRTMVNLLFLGFTIYSNLFHIVFLRQTRVTEKKTQPAKKPAANLNAAAKTPDGRAAEGKTPKVHIVFSQSPRAA